MNRLALSALALMVTVALSGCGDKSENVQITGKISIDGEPIPKGTISFVSADGETPTGGGVIKDGSYTALVPPGDKVVLVLGNKVVGKEPLYQGVPDSPTRDSYEKVTPDAYNAAHLTPLKATITESQENLDFELTKDVKTK
ncbi:S24/S26 family peptidase [Thalassoroseus pseudoceratinae]|uniref:hypothetical protein n=1 Tax=Thalassoroseus pseudoceratinae TaxID=2713176 RepID=UPI0014222F0C|nr:hypothetical protein [Thalassoroseus pseudoceratinae]